MTPPEEPKEETPPASAKDVTWKWDSKYTTATASLNGQDYPAVITTVENPKATCLAGGKKLHTAKVTIPEIGEVTDSKEETTSKLGHDYQKDPDQSGVPDGQMRWKCTRCSATDLTKDDLDFNFG